MRLPEDSGIGFQASPPRHSLRNKKVSGWITKRRERRGGAVKGGIGDNRGKRGKKGGRKRSVHNTRVRTNEQEMKMQADSVGVTLN